MSCLRHDAGETGNDMLNALISSGLFKPWVNPDSGVTSYLFSDPAIPFTQNFYFVNDGFHPDHPFAWINVAYPPSGKCLGVLDFASGRISVFPDTHFLDASPMMHPETGEAYWFSRNVLWRRSRRPEDKPVAVNHFPDELAKNRNPKRISTHLTLRSDRKTVNIDAEFGKDWMIGEMPLDGSPLNIWKRESICYNHGQFSPVDPDIQLVNQDGWIDPTSGQHHDYSHRMWLFRRDGSAEPIFDHATHKHGHEWWDPNGRLVWYIHYGVGVERVDIVTRQHEVVWPGEFSHAYSSADGNFLVTDQCVYSHAPRCEVEFLNRITGKRVHLCNVDWGCDPFLVGYHVHPHPRFMLNDTWICYTSIVRGRVEVALASVAELIAKTT